MLLVEFLTRHFTAVGSDFCSLAAVVSATVASLQCGGVEKSSFQGCYRLGTPGGRIGTFQSRSFMAVVVSWAV